jgi:hypothetical protein
LKKKKKKNSSSFELLVELDARLVGLVGAYVPPVVEGLMNIPIHSGT